MTEQEKFERKLLETLIHAGVSNLKINYKQRKKLKGWILGKLLEKYIYAPGLMPIRDVRQYIDAWETDDPDDYTDHEDYYIKKNSDGKSLWDLI